jgi:hypothetical protein
MKVYCYRHYENHHLTAGEAEQVIYALSAGYADELTNDPSDLLFAGLVTVRCTPSTQSNAWKAAELRKLLPMSDPLVALKAQPEGVFLFTTPTKAAPARVEISRIHPNNPRECPCQECRD